MNINKHRYLNYLLFIIAISFFWTCSPKLNYNVKSFFFDGVPSPYKVEVSKIGDSINNNIFPVETTIASTTLDSGFKLHTPYKDRECASCHDRNNMGKAKLPLPQLCNQCHDDLNKTYKFLHGPVASGSCNQCHDPHQSKLKNLLLKPDQELCLNCHDSAPLFENTIHAEVKNTNCVECHNPHGGSNKLGLQDESCYKCHDNYKKDYKFLHSPVASGNCFECHGSHKDETPNYLLFTGDNLCLNCHDSKDIENPEYHLNIEKTTCVKCHNPHGGKNDKFFLNKQ